MERSGAFQRHFLADHIRRTLFEQRLHLFFRQIPAMAIVAAALFFIVEGFQTFFCAEAVIRLSLTHQLFRVGTIQVFPLALDIRAKRAADIRALVMFEPHLSQRVVNHLHGAFHQTFLIGILNAQNKLAALRFRNQVFI